MTRRIELFETDDFFQEKVIEIVQATTLEWTRRVKKATPVDTGRLRSAWQTKIPLMSASRNRNSFDDIFLRMADDNKNKKRDP